jgi:hypothetical protein
MCEDYNEDPVIKAGLQRLMDAQDEANRVLDEREAVLEFIRKEVESFGGQIQDVFCDRVIAEFPEFPAELCHKIYEKGWKSWRVDANEVTVFLR